MTEGIPEDISQHPDLQDLQPPSTEVPFSERAAAGLELLASAEPLVMIDDVPLDSTLHVDVLEGETPQRLSFLRVPSTTTIPTWHIRHQAPDGEVREREAYIDGSVLPTSDFVRGGAVMRGMGLSYVVQDTLLVDSGTEIPEGQGADEWKGLPSAASVKPDIVKGNLVIGMMQRDSDGKIKWAVGLQQEKLQTGPITDAHVTGPEQSEQ